MSVRKRRNASGKVVWYYRFNAPGTTRKTRKEIREFGFATKEEATKAEAARRLEEQKRFEMKNAGAGLVASVPATLEKLLQEFMAQHAEEKLARKTIERYHEQAAYLDVELLKMPIADIKPLHLSREWSRLLKCGGHTRKKKTPRPLSAKTVRNIAGVVSSAFSRAIRWGLVTTNPVTNSEPPRAKKHLAIALTPAQHDMVMQAASGPWCLRAYLEIASATGCRRGELLALRWSDIVDGCAIIARSLTQTREVLEFKSTKTEKPRTVVLPPSAIVVLDDHRRQQDQLRLQFRTRLPRRPGPDIRESGRHDAETGFDLSISVGHFQTSENPEA